MWIANEDGRRLGLPANRFAPGLLGTVLVVPVVDSEEVTTLTDGEIEELPGTETPLLHLSAPRTS